MSFRRRRASISAHVGVGASYLGPARAGNIVLVVTPTFGWIAHGPCRTCETEREFLVRPSTNVKRITRNAHRDAQNVRIAFKF